ncbi:carboxylating nicotinate-nucleotide diphosphorylase [Legionella cincinnatiensis]|uniref:Probable nicotinate-nucleotide pyrophosphorylase [carboxylating] n=1 Tax=Legionella cincinnatiensis TaxID=28085 RepID=A0A378II28_9GAMM|nr:carboxylating nicotinate-nucleotide diphosphorylase [Legionella cincinnatiensis]KTC82035.1 nicotinate-nucleotide pyrophosphorylase [Legionella cincinnatiensis]STX34819.1 nicotinate-nucleotide pyrophosphorylase [Legionella cincinnatiensis]
MNKTSIFVEADVTRALQEDIGDGDVTAALLPADLKVEAEIISREPMIVCGQPWVNEVFKQIDEHIQLKWQVSETDWLDAPTTLCTVSGLARTILTAERTALNFLQTLSATATQTHFYVQKLRGTPTRLLDTRKTLPGLRVAQKYAVTCGGGFNHRMGLYDAFLIKENHIKACGSVAQAITLARQTHKNMVVEIEVETLDELREAILAQPDRIMLDNFSRDMLEKAIEMNQPKHSTLEVSGGVTLENIGEIAQLGVDFISVGAITKSIQAIDLSLLIRNIS